MEPIAKGVAARGHEVHLVAPWHPRDHARQGRGRRASSISFTTRRSPALNVFGYAAGLRADMQLQGRGVDGRAARDGRRLVQGAARRAEEARDHDARALGGARRRDRRAPRGRRCRWSSACTDRTSSSPSARRRRGAAARRVFDARRLRHGLQRRPRDRARSRSAPPPIAWRSCRTAWTRRASRRRRTRAAAVRARARPSGGRAAALHRRTARQEEGLRVPDRRAARWSRACAAGASGDRRRRRSRGGAARARDQARRRRSRALPRRSVAGRRRAAGSPPPTSSPCRRSATTAATSTGCRTSRSRRSPPARRWSRTTAGGIAQVIDGRSDRADRPRTRPARRSAAAIAALLGDPARAIGARPRGPRRCVEARLRLGRGGRAHSRRAYDRALAFKSLRPISI